MIPGGRKERIAKAFSAKASGYDLAADVQWLVARRLAERVERLEGPGRILEIGCGTGFLSGWLTSAFPDSEVVLTDISASMLERCRARIGDRPRYVVLDGERPESLQGKFDLIVASLAFQWFVDLKGGLERLSKFLAPGGEMQFATLGRMSFVEWREAHAKLGLTCGTPQYPGIEDFPWPAGFRHRAEEELLRQPYADGRDFIKTLKALGAGEPAPGYTPLSAGAFRRLLASLEHEFTVTYHVLFGEIRA